MLSSSSWAANEFPNDARRILDGTGLMELTTTDRKSGLPRSVEVSFSHREGQLFLLAFHWSQWVRNLRAHPAAEARVGPLTLWVEAVFPADPGAGVELTREQFTAMYGEDYLRRWYKGSGWRPVVLAVKGWTKE